MWELQQNRALVGLLPLCSVSVNLKEVDQTTYQLTWLVM